MATGDLPLSGENCPITFFFGGQPIGAEKALSLRVSEKSTDHDDSYMGKDRDIPDKQINGYSATVTYNVGSAEVLKALEQDAEDRRHNKPLKSMSLQFSLIGRGGVDTSYMLVNCIARMDVDAGSRKDRVRITLRIDASDLKRILG
jgi:hypothetical protein